MLTRLRRLMGRDTLVYRHLDSMTETDWHGSGYNKMDPIGRDTLVCQRNYQFDSNRLAVAGSGRLSCSLSPIGYHPIASVFRCDALQNMAGATLRRGCVTQMRSSVMQNSHYP